MDVRLDSRPVTKTPFNSRGLLDELREPAHATAHESPVAALQRGTVTIAPT
jgi:hypothetical protein